ncbi:PPOX class F420-dependent oxidoreductase [Streptomyces oryzae]|uniref:PPOX class F420-dependent oxidoreductase n=1 Tax=Streptomyces oryzae TaxID=1434886 RepID=A0ABS3X903_9ACTN|nr:PPOX class F420-dependent oxidoreductase [Streptomyces oryzae]MBO8191845.1 PPOX class F420-dependent oxidoreductase [Streptomyces oryzae]
MSQDSLRGLLAAGSLGILATLRSNGRPQLSPVQPSYDPVNDVVLISTREGLAKTRNFRRDPQAALVVTSGDGRAWATAEGVVTLHGPGTAPDDPAVEALVNYYRTAAGEHPDWDEYRQVMVADRRVLIELHVDHIYGDKIA